LFPSNLSDISERYNKENVKLGIFYLKKKSRQISDEKVHKGVDISLL